MNILNFEPLSFSSLGFFNEVRNLSADQLHDSRIFTLEETRIWFQKENKTKYWLIYFNHKPVGYFRVMQISKSEVQIGADIHPKFRRKGIAYLAYRNFAQNILDKRNIETCSLKVLRNNFNAIKLYFKLGFKIVDESNFDYVMQIKLRELID
jgi:ribosomal protein S18 acetylase RimI-like enzyme